MDREAWNSGWNGLPWAVSSRRPRLAAEMPPDQVEAGRVFLRGLSEASERLRQKDEASGD